MINEIITSRQNKNVVELCKLTDKKFRDREKLFRFDGIKLYKEALCNDVEIAAVFIKESESKSLLDIVDRDNIEVIVLENTLFDRISEEKSPEGIITVAKHIDKIHKIATIDKDCDFDSTCKGGIILLEDVRNPGNLGTVLRTSAALGIECVVLCGDCADIYNSKTVRGSMGAVFRLPTYRVQNGRDAVTALRKSGRRVYAAALTGNAVGIGEIDLYKTDCIAIGNEGHGLSKALIEATDGSVIIPMTAGSESLNAASAATIFIWELCKARG